MSLRGECLPDQSQNAQEDEHQRGKTDATHMFLGISLGGLAVRILLVIVPTSSSASDDEGVGLDQEHQGPKQENNVERE